MYVNVFNLIIHILLLINICEFLTPLELKGHEYIGFYSYMINLMSLNTLHIMFRSSRPEVFLRKGVLNICSKLTGEHPCRSAISIKLLCKNKQVG